MLHSQKISTDTIASFFVAFYNINTVSLFCILLKG
ncbi:hypothetical protein FAEPRAM212_03437 [Faecalibacterium prausnitzii M21/2]|uniref:Uncharacterized protein n=1 Tax=Faecalibacterium prausnitzii M21/2 TaxID=411485 RepID=A8SHQ3_9FIRM|nr:hypothetical protein FAEPRAM212_03437 [Faecalibacterium prausnitzii M21/2]